MRKWGELVLSHGGRGHALSISFPPFLLNLCVTPLILRRFTLDLALPIRRPNFTPPIFSSFCREMHRRHMSSRPSPPSIYVSTHCEILLLLCRICRAVATIFSLMLTEEAWNRTEIVRLFSPSSIFPRGWIFLSSFFFFSLFLCFVFFFSPLDNGNTTHNVVTRIK